MKVAITGASGFVGTHLKRIFEDHVVIERSDDLDTIIAKLDGVDTVINLAGAPIIKRWSSAYKKVLWDSRVETTKRLVRAVNASDAGHFISTSATGIYPDGRECDESCTEYAADFLSELAMRWEEEAFSCSKTTTVLRFGVVLGRNGGALSKMIPIFRLCAGGPIGDGSMMTSWIDIDDLMRIYRFVIERKSGGIYNAVSPNPVTNYEFSRALSRIYGCPFMIPVPRLVIRLIFGEGSCVLTGSKTVYPARLLKEGFSFLYPDIESSIRHQIKG